ncbi:MAG: hypothetical protein Q9208_008224 [Pyrenodesmia sp. 3 TL-2023]
MDAPPASRFAIRHDRASAQTPSTTSPHKLRTSAIGLEDPLLSHLSSTAALDALAAAGTSDQSAQDEFYCSITAATPSERALAFRAAAATRELERWHEELQQWHWPHNGFEPPVQQSPARHCEKVSTDNLGEEASVDDIVDIPDPAQEYWGSLLGSMALGYEKRIEQIRDAMDALELNEMKMHIRDVHFTSRPSSTTRDDQTLASDYNHLDDFTAIVTTIIMRALPIAFHLNTLLGVWEVRLAVLRAVPGFTSTMRQTQYEMTAAWRAFAAPYDGQDRASFTRPYLLGFKERLESQIRDLGQRLDFMLDTLESRQDTIPDAWIDDMEQLEAEFGDWVVEAEKMVVDWELRDDKPLRRLPDAVVNTTNARSSTGTTTREEHQTLAGPALAAGCNSTSATADDGALDGSSPTPDLMSDSSDGSFPSSSTQLPPNEHRPTPLKLQHRRYPSNALSDFSSDSSYPGSATSEYFSSMPSPEIHDALKTVYFGVGSPVEVTTPSLLRRESRASDSTVTRQSSQRTERGDPPLSAIISPPRSRASTIVQEPTISQDLDSAGTFVKKDRRSLPNIAFGNAIPDQEVRVSAIPENHDQTPPVPRKPRHRFENFTDLSPGNTPVKLIRRKTAEAASMPTTPQAKAERTPTVSPTKSIDDELEARINLILTDIPADIQLARNTDLNSDRMSQSSASRAAKLVGKSATPRLVRSQTTVPSPSTMTLTAAKQKTVRPQNGEPEVKLYHLHQSGKQAPIKLFVRLVGEGGERVMVRIGGGWADLAEYLKEYAIHHGRHTLSDGPFDIQGLPRSLSSSPATTLSSLSNTQTPKSRPGSANAECISSGAASRARRFSTSVSGFSSTSGDAPSSPDDARPISRDSNASSRHSWVGEDSPSLGLAGPKSRKATVSPNKQAWVDTMVEKARSGNSEIKQPSRNAFGDLGIMGGRLSKMSIPLQDSIFDDYVIQSATPDNTINLQVSLAHLNRALRSALTASTASLRLTKKDNVPLLSLTILTNTLTSFRPPPSLDPQPLASDTGYDNGAGNDSVSFADGQGLTHFSGRERETTITQSVPVTVLAPASVANIHEPRCREPDVHIMLPPLIQLKTISERFTRLAMPPSKGNANTESSSTRLIVSASPHGELKLGVQTSALKIESKWTKLVNPDLDPGQVDGGEEGVRKHASTLFKQRPKEAAWASVRVEGRDWGRVLGVGRLGGRVVACFCDDHALILYVYLSNAESGVDESVLTYYIASYSQ